MSEAQVPSYLLLWWKPEDMLGCADCCVHCGLGAMEFPTWKDSQFQILRRRGLLRRGGWGEMRENGLWDQSWGFGARTPVNGLVHFC